MGIPIPLRYLQVVLSWFLTGPHWLDDFFAVPACEYVRCKYEVICRVDARVRVGNAAPQRQRYLERKPDWNVIIEFFILRFARFQGWPRSLTR